MPREGKGPGRPGKSPDLLCGRKSTPLPPDGPGVQQGPAHGHTGCAQGQWKGHKASAAARYGRNPAKSRLFSDSFHLKAPFISPCLQHEEVRLEALRHQVALHL